MARKRISVGEWEELAKAAQYDGQRLAELCDLSCRQLRRVIREETGASPKAWLNQLRLIAARRRLLSGDPVKKVALDLGFKQTSHFCRRFKSFQHMTPSEFILLNAGAGRYPPDR